MTSGQPVNLTYWPTSQFSVSGDPTYRPNVTGDVDGARGQRSIDNYFNKDNVQLPTDPRFPFGNAGRNVARGYSFHNPDMGLHKDFRLAEGRRLEFRGEFFNLLNKTNFGAPNGTRPAPPSAPSEVRSRPASSS